MANPFRIRSNRYPNRPASAHEVIAMLGIANGHLPVDGLLQRDIQGIKVYVRPLAGDAPTNHAGRRFSLRVMAVCPACQRHVAASRLAQHRCPSPLATIIAEAMANKENS